MGTKKVAVLGGGISGLTAAWNMIKSSNSVQVTVYEASKRVGGWMKTERTDNGAVFEWGPRSLRAAGSPARATMELVSKKIRGVMIL